MMSANVQRRIGILLQYAQMGLNIVLSLAFTPIMLRVLGQAEFGLYNLSNSIVSYLSLLSLGFGASYIRFYARSKEAEERDVVYKLNGLFMLVFVAMGIVAFSLGLVLAENVTVFLNNSYSTRDREVAETLMILMSINLGLSFPDSVFMAYISAQERFVFQKALNVIKTVLGPFVTLPILMLGYGSIGMAIVSTAVTCLMFAMNVWFCLAKLKMKFCFREIDWGMLKEVAIFSSFIAINQLVDQINWSVDKIILGKVCSSSVVAVYTIGAQINTYYVYFSTAISSMFVPKVNQIVASQQEEKDKNSKLTQLFIQIGRVQFMVMVLILSGFIFFGQKFISIWAGAGYEKAYAVALLLIVPVTVPLIQNIGIEIQRAKNKHQFRSLVYLVMAFANVGISIFFAMKWGEIGAAAGTTIALVLANIIVMNIYYQKVIGIDIICFWKSIIGFVPALLCPFGMGIALHFYEYRGIADYIGCIFLYSIIYSLSMYFVGMNSCEKDLIRRMVHRNKREC